MNTNSLNIQKGGRFFHFTMSILPMFGISFRDHIPRKNKYRKYGVQFEKSKYVLVHYTRNSRQETKAKVTVDGTTIEASNEARYLGVIFDKKLNFKSHLQHVIKKGTRAALALSGIAKSNWGVQYTHARKLFISVIAARTDYAASIWHRPEATTKRQPPRKYNDSQQSKDWR